MKHPLMNLGWEVVFQIGAAIVVSLTSMTSCEWVAWATTAVPILRDDGVSDNEITWVVALVDLGNVITPIPSSYFMDYFGRKTGLYLAGLLYLLVNVLICVANNIWFFYIARLFDGLAKGIIFTIVPIYLTEIANVQIRGALSTIFISSYNLGLFYGYLLGWLLSYTKMLIAYSIIPILFIIIFFFVPESPYYLVMKKKEKQAIKSLAKFKLLNADSEVLLQEYDILKTTVSRDMENKSRFRDLMGSKANRRALLIIGMLVVFQRATGVTPIFLYATTIFPKTGGGASIEVYLIFLSFILVVANNVAMLLIENWGRKSLIICSSIGTAIVQAVAGTFFLLQASGNNVDSWTWIPYACFVIVCITYSIGLAFIPSTLVGELFPMNVKSYAGSFFSILVAANSFCINKVFLLFPVQYMYFFCSFACLVSTWFCIFFVFETKGKTFSQIQEELRKFSGDES